MTLKIEFKKKQVEIVGKGTIDGIVPVYFKDQGHRWMVRIGKHWTFKQYDDARQAAPVASSARNKIYWAVAQFRNETRELKHGSSAA